MLMTEAKALSGRKLSDLAAQQIEALAAHHLDVASAYDAAGETAGAKAAALYRALASEHRYAADRLGEALGRPEEEAEPAPSARRILYRGMAGAEAIVDGEGPEAFAYVTGLEREILARYDRLLSDESGAPAPLDAPAALTDQLRWLRRDLHDRLAALETV